MLDSLYPEAMKYVRVVAASQPTNATNIAKALYLTTPVGKHTLKTFVTEFIGDDGESKLAGIHQDGMTVVEDEFEDFDNNDVVKFLENLIGE